MDFMVERVLNCIFLLDGVLAMECCPTRAAIAAARGEWFRIVVGLAARPALSLKVGGNFDHLTLAAAEGTNASEQWRKIWLNRSINKDKNHIFCF
jgi:hypothetical protein